MFEGLLWWDNTQSTLPEKVMHAAAAYRNRMRQEPNLCIVNEDDFEVEHEKIGQITVKPGSNVRRNHFWIGRGDQKPELAL